MEAVAVERSIWIGASREQVWQAITDPKHLAQWLLPPMLEAQMKRDDQGTLFVCMGPMEIPIAVLAEVAPLRQVTSQGLPDRLIAITYTLDQENDGTRVTVAMSGFEALPEDSRQDRINPSGAAWEKALENLKAYLAGTDLPFPEGYVAALFGYRREVKETFAIERSIWIAASRERVWQAITDPTQIEKWFSPGTSWKMSALEVGGRLFVPDAETGAEMYTQVIERLDSPHLFVLRSVPEPSGASQVTAHRLLEERGGTRLIITNSGYELMPEDARWAAMEQNAVGFGMMLENVQAYSEGRDIPYPGGF